MPNSELLVVDMGGWQANHGSVWLLKPTADGYEKQRLLDKLDRPNGIAQGPDGLIYVGAVKRVFRFDPRDPAGSVTDVIGGASSVAPLPGLGRHLLTSMRFDRHGDLFVNVGLRPLRNQGGRRTGARPALRRSPGRRGAGCNPQVPAGLAGRYCRAMGKFMRRDGATRWRWRSGPASTGYGKAKIAATRSRLPFPAWNIACRRVPVTLPGQLILFETLFALLYGFIHQHQWPRPLQWAAMVLLASGVRWSARVHAIEADSAPL